jgi:Flp pilus assembly protein TadG
MAARTLWESRRMARDRRGASALEFAMITPILILLYVGIVEIGNLLTLHRRAASVASTAADLTAQVKSVATVDLEDILKASGTLLTPYSTTPLKVVLSSVVADQNNVGKVEWSCANKGAGRGAGSTFALPVGLTVADSSVIVAEVTYSYKPTLGLSEIFSPRAFEMKRTFYARPRKSFKVTKTESGCPSV